MTTTDRDGVVATMLSRYPLPPAQRVQATRVLHQALEEGRAVDEVERELVAWLEQQPEMRLALAREQVRVAFAGEALALGAVYDGAHDAWTPPTGQSWTEFVAAVADRLEVSPEELQRMRAGGALD